MSDERMQVLRREAKDGDVQAHAAFLLEWIRSYQCRSCYQPPKPELRDPDWDNDPLRNTLANRKTGRVLTYQQILERPEGGPSGVVRFTKDGERWQRICDCLGKPPRWWVELAAYCGSVAAASVVSLGWDSMGRACSEDLEAWLKGLAGWGKQAEARALLAIGELRLSRSPLPRASGRTSNDQIGTHSDGCDCCYAWRLVTLLRSWVEDPSQKGSIALGELGPPSGDHWLGGWNQWNMDAWIASGGVPNGTCLPVIWVWISLFREEGGLTEKAMREVASKALINWALSASAEVPS